MEKQHDTHDNGHRAGQTDDSNGPPKERPKWYLNPLLYVALALLAGPILLAWIVPGMLGFGSASRGGGESLSANSYSGESLPRIIISNKVLYPCELLNVVDGDTIRVKLGEKLPAVRFLRINTPEKEGFGYRDATDTLRVLLQEKELFLEFEQPGHPETDKFYRLLAYVHARSPAGPLKNINVEMVRSGWTAFWLKFGGGKYAADLAAAQREAQEAKRGLWKNDNGVMHGEDPPSF